MPHVATAKNLAAQCRKLALTILLVKLIPKMADDFWPGVIADDDIRFFAEVTAGGRRTIPEEIHKILQIKDGDAVFCRLKIMSRRK